MKALLLISLLFSLNSFAADHSVEFLPGPGSVGNPEVSSITSSKVSDLSQAVDLMFPAGMVQSFALNACPSGWAKADGLAVSRVGEYARLFAAMGVIHGSGDGSTTFNLPDYRGRFLRGASEASILDADKSTRTAMAGGGATGNNVGSVQSHAFESHTHIQNSHAHSLNDPGHNHEIPAGTNQNSNGSSYFPPMATSQGAYTRNTATKPTGITINAQTAINQNAGSSSETRPVNAYVLFCVKK